MLFCVRVNIVLEVLETACKNVGKYCGGEKILSPPWFQHCGASTPVASAVPTPLKYTRHDTRCYFNVRSKADISQLNLPHASTVTTL